ncbi:MAG: hypothetical protein IT452_06870 [Planctomycetia bacterium]|nr:hypothetical protein [Planctomycetia bacterium]
MTLRFVTRLPLVLAGAPEVLEGARAVAGAEAGETAAVARGVIDSPRMHDGG